MKPDGGPNENLMETAEVEPGEFFVELGMLILESRLPTLTVKGRQDGRHCPLAVGDRSSHVCDAKDPLCKKASEIKRQMQTLWCNHIPMCIEVLLFPECSHGLQKAASVDLAPPVIGDGCLLLEQWTIQLAGKKTVESCISSKALLQAMRSYLHFSQLSAWLNLTHGKEPRHIGYRISPPAEFCTSTFSKTPDSHLFPLTSVNKSTKIKVTMSHLPRLPEIPKPVCHEMTGRQPCGFVDYLVTCLPRSSSPKPGLQAGQRSNSPKLDKPNVLHALSAEEREILTRPSKCSCAECLASVGRSTDMEAAQLEQSLDLKLTSGFQKSSHDFESKRQKSPTGFAVESSDGRPWPVVAKDTGAVPKRLSLQLKSIPEDVLTQHPRSPQHSKTSQIAVGDDDDDDKTNAQKKSGLKCGIPTLLPPFMDHCKDLIPEVLPIRNSLLFLDGDSSGSSPDYDHFLSKTLMKQSDPLTLEEMEKYLHRLYQPTADVFRASGNGAHDAAVFAGKLKPRNNLDGKLDRRLLPTTPQEDESFNTKIPFSLQGERQNLCAKDLNDDSELLNCGHRLTKKKPAEVKAERTEKCASMPMGHAIENVDVVPVISKITEKSCIATASSCDDATADYRPVFVVGDVAESDEKTGNSEVALSTVSVANGGNVFSAASDDSCSSAGATRKETEFKPVTLSQRTLHKSTSCPSKPAFRSGGCSRVKSLLKTVMKREMVSQQSDPVDIEVAAPPSPCVPTSQEKIYFLRCVQKSASMVFHATTGLPLQSSPVPAKKLSCGSFDYDSSLNSVRAIKNSLSCFDLDAQNDDDTHLGKVRHSYSTSAPASTNCLLGNFEESLINGRIEPAGVVNGFTVDIGASGSFCPPHITLPVTAFFFSLSDDHAPSPYLGHINLESYSKRGYHIPKQGTIQVTLFNPNKTVVKMFVVKYDMSDMPPSHQTVLRQRTLYMPVKGSPSDVPGFIVYLRYLIHLRFASSKSSKIYLHTDIRVIFARDKFELDSRVANYELRSFTEGPENPKFSPKK